MAIPTWESRQTAATKAQMEHLPCQTSQNPTASQLFRVKIIQSPALARGKSPLYRILLIQVFQWEMQVAKNQKNKKKNKKLRTNKILLAIERFLCFP